MLILCFQSKAQTFDKIKELAVKYIAGDTNKTVNFEYDTNFVKSYRDVLNITFVAVNRNLDISVKNSNDVLRSINYSTNNGMSFGFGLDYKWLGVEFSTKFGFLNNKEPKKLNTEKFGLRIGLTGRKFWFNGTLQLYKGLHISNPTIFDANYFTNNYFYPARPDISSLALFASLYYSFNNKRYSNLAATFQLEKQKKSAGTFLTGISASLNDLKADRSLVPENLKAFYPNQILLNESTTKGVCINFGYAHNFIIKKHFFINLALIPGLGIQSNYSKNELKEESFYRRKLGVMVDSRFSLGYNGDLFYAGILNTSNSFIGNEKRGGLLDFDYSYFRFFVGIRLPVEIKNPTLKKIFK